MCVLALQNQICYHYNNTLYIQYTGVPVFMQHIIQYMQKCDTLVHDSVVYVSLLFYG